MRLLEWSRKEVRRTAWQAPHGSAYAWIAVTRLLEWLNVDIKQWSANELANLQSYSSPSLASIDSETLTVLLSNRRVVPHYDLLVPREASKTYV